MITNNSRRLRLDPYAVAAVSRVEGGGTFGAVGDKGTSYGPFQLHRGGALPAGKTAAWANSQAGVRYAMSQMSRSGAAGKRGLSSINQIVRRFERPADPEAEVQKAFKLYKDMGAPKEAFAYGARVAGLEKGYQGQMAQGLFAQTELDLVAKVGPLSQRAATFISTLSQGEPPEAAGQTRVKGGVTRPIKPKGGGGWGGSVGVVNQITSGVKLTTTSEKRNRKSTASGGVSDHWMGSKTAFARDMGGSVAAMDAAAVRIARQLGIKYKKGQPLVATINRGGYRIQVLYRTMTGGDHFDHIHVGVARR